MIARERLRTSRMRSCFLSILADPGANAGLGPPDAWPGGLLWLSPDIETAPHLLGVIKHSRQSDARDHEGAVKRLRTRLERTASQISKGSSHRPVQNRAGT